MVLDLFGLSAEEVRDTFLVSRQLVDLR